jgi:hypothetical protein
MINNGKALSSVLMPPLLPHEQGTTNNAKSPSFVPSPLPPLPLSPSSLPSRVPPLLTLLRKQRGDCTTLLHAATVDIVVKVEGQSMAPWRHHCYPLACRASCPLVMLPPLEMLEETADCEDGEEGLV